MGAWRADENDDELDETGDGGDGRSGELVGDSDWVYWQLQAAREESEYWALWTPLSEEG